VPAARFEVGAESMLGVITALPCTAASRRRIQVRQSVTTWETYACATQQSPTKYTRSPVAADIAVGALRVPAARFEVGAESSAALRVGASCPEIRHWSRPGERRCCSMGARSDTGLTALQLLGPFVSVAAESQQRSLRPWGRILGTLH
jgi:hypothetical protein